MKLKTLRDALVRAGVVVDPTKPAPPRVRNAGVAVELVPGVKIRRRADTVTS